jgi:hypothetical protein|nr:MAG TPA: hypothetical protein [Caudoviricetes sp.]
MEELLDTREELNKTVSEMNHIVKEIIKVANTSNQEEKSKISILQQLLNKTENLINVVITPQEDLNVILNEQRRWILLDMEDRIRRSELEMLDRIKYLLERERNH